MIADASAFPQGKFVAARRRNQHARRVRSPAVAKIIYCYLEYLLSVTVSVRVLRAFTFPFKS